MSFYRTFLFILIGLSLISCGRRTAPEPYPSVSISLPAIQEVSLIYRGDHLMLRWKDPVFSAANAALTAYKLSIFAPNIECVHCNPILLDSIEIQNEDSSNIKMVTANKEHQVILRENLLQEHLNSEKSYMVFSYINLEGRFSPPSKALYLRKPLKIPLPVILSVEIANRVEVGHVASSFAQATDPEEKNFKKSANRDLVVQWKPVQETIQQILGKSDKIREKVRNYGLNFYSLNDDGLESLINLQPLLRGRIRFAYGGGKIVGRHVDRYDNESLPIQVYEGK